MRVLVRELRQKRCVDPEIKKLTKTAKPYTRNISKIRETKKTKKNKKKKKPKKQKKPTKTKITKITKNQKNQIPRGIACEIWFFWFLVILFFLVFGYFVFFWFFLFFLVFFGFLVFWSGMRTREFKNHVSLDASHLIHADVCSQILLVTPFASAPSCPCRRLHRRAQ